ncbi:hypothetical protein [Clostridium sp.]|uniref:hypothetical protein n=1 Tax=Clostridium sp. TaxID=1506 RepID=UPI0026337C31
MNSIEREIYDKYAYKKTHIYLVYEEFERRVNSTDSEYDGLKKGECSFNYSAWEKRLGISKKLLQNSIKQLVDDNVIIQTYKGGKGRGSSKYFLMRFNINSMDNKKDNYLDNNLDNYKTSNSNAFNDVLDNKKDNYLDNKMDNTSIYNNLNIKSNNIYSSNDEDNISYFESINKEIDDLENEINNKYDKDLITKEKEKLKDKSLGTLDLLRELKKQLDKSIKRNSNQDIEKIWSLYPLKKGKASAIKKIPKLLKEYGKEQIVRCIDRYIKYVDSQRNNGFSTLKYKDGSTFFNSGYMDYLDCNYQEDIITKPKKEPKRRGTNLDDL